MSANLEIYDFGIKVEKISGRPFKSKLKINTIKGIINHPERVGKFAYLFEEDDSYVATDGVVKVEEQK